MCKQPICRACGHSAAYQLSGEYLCHVCYEHRINNLDSTQTFEIKKLPEEAKV